VLLKAKRIAKLPDWAGDTDLTAKPDKQKCVSCGSERLSRSALKCATCNWPFDPLAAYEAGLIEFEHVSISALPVEELKKAYTIKNTREKNRELAMAGTAAK
jgi:hypothetical protein